MLSLFAPKLPIDRDELDWQLATFKWLGAEFGPAGEAPLVLPTAEYFPPSKRKGAGRVEDLFASVKSAAGMADWACELSAGTGDRPAHVGLGLLLRHEGASPPCGTFTVDDGEGGGRVVITYNPSLANDTTALIATFAHELAHYLMSTARNAPPGGWELHELHTDLAAVYLGFGLFLANSARNFGQFQDAGEMGWSSRTQGYLSEGALVTATAIFQRLAGRDPMAAAPWLKDYLRSDLRKAVRALDRIHPDLPASVAAVDLSDFAGG
ncbi:MAG TPA: hypothetical protein VFP12_10600 [Allosphingosinicella sp.]|nr:hypothetical protein [Allosphingosinicella sp.]